MSVRTTITLEDDVAAAAGELRRKEGIGISEAVNRLARAGLTRARRRTRYGRRGLDLGIKIDVSDIGSVLELLDES